MKRDFMSNKSCLGDLFFDSPVSSTETLAGVVRQLPGSGAPCSSIAYSGLSRSQQQVAMQALGPPATPCFSGNQGGLMLDGVVLRTGGVGWWAALSGRFRAQKAINMFRDSKLKDRKKRFKEALKGENFGICCRCKWTLGRKSTLNLMYEISSLEDIRQKLSQPEQYPEQFQTGHLQLKHKLMPGHELTGSVACNLRYQDETGKTGNAVPLLASVDLGTSARNEPLFQYRLGISNVVGQLYEKGETQALQAEQDDNPYVQQTSVQGAAGLSKRFTLYQNLRNGKRKSARKLRQQQQQQSKAFLNQGSRRQFSQDYGYGIGGQQHQQQTESKSQNESQSIQQQQQSPTQTRAQELQKLLVDARKRIDYLRTSVREMIEDVEDGTFREQLKLLGKGSSNRRNVYNVFAGSKIQLGLKGGWRVHHILRPALPSTPTPLSPSLPTSSAPFAQVNLHTQIGNFTRPILSFTNVNLGFQYNLISQKFNPTNLFLTDKQEISQRGENAPYNSVFVLESGRHWNCASVGVVQQLIGPIVGRADYKFEVKGFGQGQQLQHRLVDECYGIDVALPGGVAKFSVWWAPKHREAFAEIRTW